MARGYTNLRFEWNDVASVIIQNLGFGKELNKEAAEILYDYAYPYVPYKEGNLSSRVRFTATKDHGTVTHLVKYADKQYTLDPGNGEGNDENVERTRTFHPLATSYWYEWAWSNHSREITKDIDEARLKYRSFKYGK